MEGPGFQIETTLDTADLLKTCTLKVTATPAGKPILHAIHLRPGTHITAVGSDTPHKQEMDAQILARAGAGFSLSQICYCADPPVFCGSRPLTWHIPHFFHLNINHLIKERS